MPPRGAVAPAAGGRGQPGAAGGQQQQQAGAGSTLISTILRMGMMWYMFNAFKGPQASGGGAGGAGGVTLTPLHARGTPLDVRFYLSERPELAPDGGDGATLIWQVNDVPLGTLPQNKFTYTYAPSEAVKSRNASVWLHAQLAVAGVDPAVRDELPPGSVFVKSVNLVRYMPKPKNKTGVNLLSSDGPGAPVTTPKPDPTEGPAPWLPFWKPNMTLALVDHFNAYARAGVPQPLRQYFEFADADATRYLPMSYYDEFWLLRDKLVALNETVTELPLHLVLQTSSFWWVQLQQQMDQSFQMQVNLGVAADGESDEVKRIFLEGNPVLLGITMVVSLLHSVFDFMAFKNDVAFWKDNRSMEGLSARSILVNAFCQLIILFYLLDNDTSTVVLVSSAVGTAIEFWKVTKAFDVSVGRSWPFISIKDKASYKDSRHNTNKHDAEAMRYLSYALYPCVIGYSIYSLMYEKHRSWYSWVLGSLVGAVYTFGFILMCPQLYLNYKLKSVAHLPWRQMTYKFLNTIIDDLFAFVIKMPILHRLSVFRDDVIFMIFLYQRWIYRVDKTRVNEFGFSGEMAEERAARERAAAAAGGGSGGEAATAAAAGGSGAAVAAEGAAEGEAAAADGDSGEGTTVRRRKAAAAASRGSGGAADEGSADEGASDEADKDK